METEVKLLFVQKLQSKTEEISPLALAYIGDAVYELLVRTLLIDDGVMQVDRLHKKAVNLVRAGTQADLLHEIESWLTGEELRIMKRGRNAKSGSIPKNADVIAYRHSTGLESLIGYWYLKGEESRLGEFFTKLNEFYINQGEQ